MHTHIVTELKNEKYIHKNMRNTFYRQIQRGENTVINAGTLNVIYKFIYFPFFLSLFLNSLVVP